MKGQSILSKVKQTDPNQHIFHQAVEEVFHHAKLALDQHPKYRRYKIFERMAEPERVISFRINWLDNDGEVQVNRGYRVQMNSALGPFKGGLRFHPSVNEDILKFLAFEQIFKNSLTGLPLGAGKGGANFSPKNRSENEIMHFCQNYMSELHRHIGRRVDIPAGDIGVGRREIGYLFGTYKKLKNEFSGVLTGKGIKWGGSVIREEATGFGLVYFVQFMLENQNESFEDKKCIVSGAGNVAQHAIEKIIDVGGIPLTASDTSGFVYIPEGFTTDLLESLQNVKNIERKQLDAFADRHPEVEFHPHDPDADYNDLWDLKADFAFPCATQNEINAKDAQHLVKNNVRLIAEGANMPLSSEALKIIQDSDILYAPGKATNAGGVATSGLEMSQNQMGYYWTRKQVGHRLKHIMKNIHDECLQAAERYDEEGNYLAGANIAGFVKVADAMIAEGVI